jgi:hypothetical protein
MISAQSSVISIQSSTITAAVTENYELTTVRATSPRFVRESLHVFVAALAASGGKR